MNNFEPFFNQLLNDVKIALTDEFDQNFERKAFFDQPWPHEKYPAKRGSLLIRSGKLRRSIQDKIQSGEIHWTSSEVYAEIQNNGGEITVTAKMKKYFWAMYYESGGNNSIESQYWKLMALMKVGSKLKIPARKFIGDHPEVDKIVREETDRAVHELSQHIFDNLRP